MYSYKARSRVRQVWVWLGLISFALLTLFPILWMFMMSLKTHVDIISSTPKFLFSPTLENYKAIFLSGYDGEIGTGRADFMLYFKNSLIVTICSVTLSLVVGVPTAYALARFRFPLKEHLAFTYLSFRFAPEIAIIIPLYILYQQLHLYNTYIGLILIYQLIALPLIVWILRGYFEEIPIDVEEAAKLDGCSWWKLFANISLPLVKPGLISTAILTFIFAWNNFIFGLILGAKETHPTTVGILGFISYENVLWGQMSAATTITIVPSMILALIIQKYLVRGLTMGAVRG